jgi:hypothetical protein
LENALRRAVLAAGADCLSTFLEGIGSGRQDEPLRCPCGARMESRGLRNKDLVTILGAVRYRRTMFQCPQCAQTRYVGDEALDIVGTSRSPGLRRMMARAGAKSTFKEARDDLRLYAGLHVSAKDVERVAETIGEDVQRWTKRECDALLEQTPVPAEKASIPILYIELDGTGVPMIPRELKGRKGKQADGSAKTREVKLGCVFTQTTTDENGYPVRDPDSTTFVGAIEGTEDFGWRLYAEALRRGLLQAERVVVLGDGAEWIRNLAEMHFPQATLIIDLYHAREHVSDLCKLLWPHDQERMEQQRAQWWDFLDQDGVETLVAQALQCLPTTASESQKKVRREINYLQKNKDRMRYASYRTQGLFVGSGVIEAACKSLIGQRLKQSGMKWSLRGANAIISLRCMMQSDRLEDYWEDRLVA